MPELGWFQWIIGGIVAVGLALFSYLNGKLTTVQDKAAANDTELLKLKLHVSETYSTKDDVKSVQSQLQHTLDRLHSRIDDIDVNLKSMPQTILNILKGIPNA